MVIFTFWSYSLQRKLIGVDELFSLSFCEYEITHDSIWLNIQIALNESILNLLSMKWLIFIKIFIKMFNYCALS